jgi:hypothetical protein
VTRWRWPRDDAKRRRWRLRVYLTAMWLCLGAVVNLLVAWACVLGGAYSRQSGSTPLIPRPEDSALFPSLARQSTGRIESVHRAIGYERIQGTYFTTIVESGEVVPSSGTYTVNPWTESANLAQHLHGYSRRLGTTKEINTGNSVSIEPDRRTTKSQTVMTLRYGERIRAGLPLSSFTGESACIHKDSSFFAFHVSKQGVTPATLLSPRPNPILVDHWTDFVDGGIPNELAWANTGWLRDVRFLITPIWPGFAINTLLYAGLCWAIVHGLQTAFWLFVHKRRRRRGLCVACKYPVAGLVICPECGLANALGNANPSAPAATIST